MTSRRLWSVHANGASSAAVAASRRRAMTLSTAPSRVGSTDMDSISRQGKNIASPRARRSRIQIPSPLTPRTGPLVVVIHQRVAAATKAAMPLTIMSAAAPDASLSVPLIASAVQLAAATTNGIGIAPSQSARRNRDSRNTNGTASGTNGTTWYGVGTASWPEVGGAGYDMRTG